MPDRLSTKVKKAEVSFLASQRGKRGRNTREQVIRKALQESSAAFFGRILDDKTEQSLWMLFMTGKAPQLGPDGHPYVNQENGLPFLVDVELNPICLKAFLQAVAYKRGTPTIMVKGEGEEGPKGPTFVFNYMGASKEFFNDKVKVLELASGKV